MPVIALISAVELVPFFMMMLTNARAVLRHREDAAHFASANETGEVTLPQFQHCRGRDEHEKRGRR
jgi:hypothetical protein